VLCRAGLENVTDTLRGLSPSLVKQLLPIVDQLTPIYMDVAQGRQEFSPSPEETAQMLRNYYGRLPGLMELEARHRLQGLPLAQLLLRAVQPPCVGTCSSTVALLTASLRGGWVLHCPRLILCVCCVLHLFPCPCSHPAQPGPALQGRHDRRLTAAHTAAAKQVGTQAGLAGRLSVGSAATASVSVCSLLSEVLT
jgi:hypothetical protein